MLILSSQYSHATINTAAFSSNALSDSTFQQLVTWPNFQITNFVDLNADRRLDILFMSNDGKKLYALIEPSVRNSQRFGQLSITSQLLPSPVEIIAPNFTEPIVSVASADFDGDSRADLLLLTSLSQEGPFKAYIAYNLGGSDVGTFGTPMYVDEFISQPLICDLNSDMISDLYAESASLPRERVGYLGGERLTKFVESYDGPAWSKLGYAAFGDVNGDLVPDIIVLVDYGGKPHLQLIIRKKISVSKLPSILDAKLIELDPSLSNARELTLGLFVLNDFTADGHIELFLPACTTANCLDSSVAFLYSFKSETWSLIDINWTPSGLQNINDSRWSFTATPKPGGFTALLTSALVGPTVGDIDLDGKPDISIGLTSWSKSGTLQASYAAVLLNQGRNSHGSLQMSSVLLPGVEFPPDNKQIRQIALFDQNEDGILDLLVVSTNAGSAPSAQLFLHSLSGDPYFLKVLVLNGLCPSADLCSDSRLPYGLAVPGITTSIDTENPNGARQLNVALLSSQSCCSSLQVPFNVYGLGQFANYVERLIVSTPPSSNAICSKVISFLVPKSQIVINPYPHDNPNAWTTKLFLQPLYDMKVVYIAITLLCVCILLLIIIGILQWFEFRDDQIEKQKEAQRFHFDAM